MAAPWWKEPRRAACSERQELCKFFAQHPSVPRLPSRPREKKSIRMSDRKAVIKNADMSEEMQQDAVDVATQALEKYNIEKDIAAYIKKEFDKKYNPTWHCIVGRNFGSYVTHETKHFIYFYLGQVAILLFKSG
ncbi:hypothetical protein HPB52_013469 [Rhipicephalus sanguineus]|uniref:Dynein light chain n=1 Tax=Rhipicephalus sanguineus TaxID=34632 RepID=A0A9D4PWC0_RHISA|nr:hypothetical protein HPB52_013469 [Rhipicephalus sanguineus]